eukprot:TRINITY_DN2756_c0_g1_i1.p1 TRINITY_DN2756_c0_g1~~TRINITY_DN2756_c0_g1_i1.p1  ORF type:complete len:466 (-),score=110.28 TRINITY_DN2756_c0_g1_i1:160-1557(-)
MPSVHLPLLFIFALSFPLSAFANNVHTIPDEVLASVNCTMLQGSTYNPANAISATPTQPDFGFFRDVVTSEAKALRKHLWSSCTESLERLACYTGLQHVGIGEVNPASYFPFLSYKPHPELKTASPFPASSHSTSPFRIAYILLVHKDEDQALRLIDAVYTRNNIYILHVDSKSPEVKSNLRELIRKYDAGNVIMMDASFNIPWGGIHMVYATLEAMFQLLDLAEWDYVINLSGQDYPLCSNSALERFLHAHPGKNFDNAVKVYGNKVERSYASYCVCGHEIAYTHRARPHFTNSMDTVPEVVQKSFTMGKYSDLPVKPRPLSDSYTGSQWFVYSRDFAKYLRTDPQAINLLAHYEHTFVPDEGYFSTVLMNSPFSDTRVPHNLRYIVWAKPLLQHPVVWTMNDTAELSLELGPPSEKTWDQMINLVPTPQYPQPRMAACFTRKFNDKKDSEIFDWIEEIRARNV